MEERVLKTGGVPEVGQYLEGTNYIVGKVHEWPIYWDLDLVDAETGEMGFFRQKKPIELS